MGLKLVTRPDGLAVSLEAVKRHLAIDSNDFDQMLDWMLRAAIARFDGATGLLNRALLPQTYDMTLDDWPCFLWSYPYCDRSWWAWPAPTPFWVVLPIAPLISVDAVTYIASEDGAETVLPAENYTVDTISEPGRLIPIQDFSWPSLLGVPNAVTIRFTAGYPEESESDSENSVPIEIRHAILMLVGDMFAHRETVTDDTLEEIPGFLAARSLVEPYRVFR